MPDLVPLAAIAPTQWSGGRTWEHLLLPKGGSYAPDADGVRRFDLRISTASVEADASDFTPLPGIDRWLTVDAPIELTIDGEPRRLAPGELLAFRGEQQVRSRGRTRDLNVMVRRDCGLRPDVRLESGAIDGPAHVVDLASRDLVTLAAGERLTSAGALTVRLG